MKIKKKGHHSIKTDRRYLYRDNAPSHHKYLCFRKFLAKHNVTTLLQPPERPDLATDFSVFVI